MYKQTILPIIDYAGFMLISCRREGKNDLQKLQNDVLMICTRTKLSDRVSIPELHAKCKIISLEQRMRKQLLWLMYLLSRDKSYLKVTKRVIRSADKIYLLRYLQKCCLYMSVHPTILALSRGMNIQKMYKICLMFMRLRINSSRQSAIWTILVYSSAILCGLSYYISEERLYFSLPKYIAYFIKSFT